MRKKGEQKTCHRKNEQKGEFGSPRNEFLGLKGGTSIMLKPSGGFW